MSVAEALLKRRSVRGYLDRPVAVETGVFPSFSLTAGLLRNSGSLVAKVRFAPLRSVRASFIQKRSTNSRPKQATKQSPERR